MRRAGSGGEFRAESGVALVVAISTLVVVGVVGAGLLVVVRSDLAATVEASRSQRALLAADAGTALAKRQLLSDARPAAYDSDGDPDPDCDAPENAEEDFGSPWSAGRGGVKREYEGGEFTVSVEWVSPGCAPPGAVREEPGREHFRVLSEGRSGETRRRVEALYASVPNGAPLGLYAAGDVRLGSSARVRDASVFAGRDVAVEAGAEVSGTDLAHGDWAGERNPAGRPGGSAAAVAGAGRVSGEPGSPVFDRSTEPRFGSEVGADALTFPFSPGYWSARRLGFLREEARAGGLYRDSGGPPAWPSGSERPVVVFVEGGEVLLGAASCPEARPCRGTLVLGGEGRVVLEEGASFEGGILTGVGDVVLEAGSTFSGPVSSGGDLEVRGEVRGGAPGSYPVAGVVRIEPVGWREVYE